jgi:hypothetical protein
MTGRWLGLVNTKIRVDLDMTIYTIHHMAATGGTIIAKAISACTDAILLSEISPYRWIKHPKKGAGFRPTALVEHLVGASSDLDRTLKRQYFVQQLDICRQHARGKQRPLLLREHSHSAFDFKSKSSDLLTIMAEEQLELRSVLSIRHPLDSFISAKKNGWHKQLAPETQGLDEYCQNMAIFVDAMLSLPNFTLMRYEDFCVDPLSEVAKVVDFLGLTVDPAGINRALDIPATGLSGRKSDRIEIRPRQEVLEKLLEETQVGVAYQQFCESFRYLKNADEAPIESRCEKAC